MQFPKSSVTESFFHSYEGSRPLCWVNSFIWIENKLFSSLNQIFKDSSSPLKGTTPYRAKLFPIVCGLRGDWLPSE